MVRLRVRNNVLRKRYVYLLVSVRMICFEIFLIGAVAFLPMVVLGREVSLFESVIWG